jgi:phenylacetate-CoA ligase
MRITGRSDDMLIIRGVNVYPSQIEAILVGLPDVTPHYQLVVERRGALDTLTIEVEASLTVRSGDAEAYRAIAERVRHQVKSTIGVSAEVAVKQPGEVPRSQGKAVRVRDLRPRM